MTSHEVRVDDRAVPGDDRPGHVGEQRVQGIDPTVEVGTSGVGWSTLLDEVAGQHDVVGDDDKVAWRVGRSQVSHPSDAAPQRNVHLRLHRTVRHECLGVTDLVGDVGCDP